MAYSGLSPSADESPWQPLKSIETMQPGKFPGLGQNLSQCIHIPLNVTRKTDAVSSGSRKQTKQTQGYLDDDGASTETDAFIIENQFIVNRPVHLSNRTRGEENITHYIKPSHFKQIQFQSGSSWPPYATKSS